MSPALANDGASSFVVFLLVLLAVMLAAVIRLPRWDGSSPEDADRQPTATAAPSRPGDAQARAAATIARAAAVLPAMRAPELQAANTATTPLPAATGQPGQARHASRRTAAPVPGEGTIARPAVSSGPPWAPAPKPSGIK